jgi:hypothetical protein
MSKSLLAFVWIAGPLSGTLVQPYIGIRSDNCRIPWGKRKPFMLAGAAATAFSLLVLAWTREIVHAFLGIFGADPASHGVKVASIVFAIGLVYILDFAINTGISEISLSQRIQLTARSHSPSRHQSLHCRQCANPSTRRCQRLGRQDHRFWKRSRIPFWLCESSKAYRRHLW